MTRVITRVLLIRAIGLLILRVMAWVILVMALFVNIVVMVM